MNLIYRWTLNYIVTQRDENVGDSDSGFGGYGHGHGGGVS